jgi:hypothetical protein
MSLIGRYASVAIPMAPMSTRGRNTALRQVGRECAASLDNHPRLER